MVGKSIDIPGGYPSARYDLSPDKNIVCSGIPGIIEPPKDPESKLEPEGSVFNKSDD